MTEPRQQALSGAPLRYVSLMAGIGGIDLGLDRAGMKCAGQVEIDEYARAVLEKHWPDVPRLADVREFRGDEFGPFDLLAAGYPCQPFSLAGARAGTADPRHLWPEVRRIIRHARPRVVLLENVPGHLGLGLDAVLRDLAALGYDAEWDCIPAAAVGAPHLRDRLFVVAHADRDPIRSQPEPVTGFKHSAEPGHDGAPRAVAYPDRERQREPQGSKPQIWRRLADFRESAGRRQWALEPDVGRVADGIPSRMDRLRGLGNAVVPQVAEFVGRQIVEAMA